MSEQNTKPFMQQLDDWTNAYVIVPLQRAIATGGEREYHDAAAGVEKAIRQKVLESYRNGQSFGPRRQPREAYQPRRQLAQDH